MISDILIFLKAVALVHVTISFTSIGTLSGKYPTQNNVVNLILSFDSDNDNSLIFYLQSRSIGENRCNSDNSDLQVLIQRAMKLIL